MWLWPLATFENRIQGGSLLVINVAIRSAEKVLKALSALLPRATIRTRITKANEDSKKYVLWSIAGIQQSSLDRER